MKLVPSTRGKVSQILVEYSFIHSLIGCHDVTALCMRYCPPEIGQLHTCSLYCKMAELRGEQIALRSWRTQRLSRRTILLRSPEMSNPTIICWALCLAWPCWIKERLITLFFEQSLGQTCGHNTQNLFSTHIDLRPQKVLLAALVCQSSFPNGSIWHVEWFSQITS